MSNPSPGAPHLSYSNPRRTSYASVAAGTAGSAGTPPSSLPPSQYPTASVLLPPAPGRHQHPFDRPSARRYSDRNPGVSSSGVAATGTGTGTGIEGRDTDMGAIPTSWGSAAGTAGFNMTNLRFGELDFVDFDGHFVPTYLRGSKYIEEVKTARKLQKASQKESEARTTSHSHGHVSASGPGSTVSRNQSVHRGMAYEIIEHVPTREELGPGSLPSRWLEVDNHKSIEIANDGHQVRFVGTSKLADHEAASARADHPIPPLVGIYYYEVYIESKGKDGMIGVGFSGLKASLDKLPGEEPESWAYHGDDGKTFCCQLTGKAFGPTFSSGDTIGCGIDFTKRTAFFTKNGNYLGNAFRDIQPIHDLYPSVGMRRPHAHLIVNFGQRPFTFDIDHLVRRQREQVAAEIASTDLSTLHPSLDKEELCKALVAQFLSHDGYVQTAQAFAEEVRTENTALWGKPESAVDSYLAVEDDSDAAKRQQIRAAILEGDIDATIQLTEQHFPGVLENNREINFRVRCRKYIEMIRQSTELLDISPVESAEESLMTPSSTNGHNDDSMDLDQAPATLQDPQSQDSETHQTTIPPAPVSATTDSRSQSPSAAYHTILNSAIIYGRDLNTTFLHDPDPQLRTYFRNTMTDLFGMLAYTDARTSPAAHHLDIAERAKVAEGLNGAILVSMGKSPSTAVERIYKQTSVLMDMIAEEGGVAALINPRGLLRASS